MRKHILEYILHRLPIWSKDDISLEQIAEKFNIKYETEATQEEIIEIILQR